MISDYEISNCPEHEVKSKTGTIFANEKMLEEYFVKIFEIDPYFYDNYKENIHVDNNDHEYILFKIDMYFAEYFFSSRN